MDKKSFRHLAVDHKGSWTVVRFRTARLLDEFQINEIGEELFHLADADEPKIAIDFAAIEFMSSSMLGKLISVQRRVCQANGNLKLCRIPADVFQVFKAAKLDEYFEFSSGEQSSSSERNLPSKPETNSTKPKKGKQHSVQMRLILEELAEIVHQTEHLQQRLNKMSERVVLLAEELGALPAGLAKAKKSNESSCEDTAEHVAWKPKKV